MGERRGERVRSFRELRVWQEAAALARGVLAVADGLPAVHGALADQLVRAATSVHANIAEGAGHSSRREFVRYLRIALASLVEVEAHVAFLAAADLLPPTAARPITDRTRRVHQLLRGLLRALHPP